MNQQDIQKIFTILQPVWPASGLDKAAIPAWTLALQHQDSGLLQEAAAEWVRTEKWFPKPSELIGIAADITYERTKHQALPAPENIVSAEDHERMLRIAEKAAAMGIKLHASWDKAIDEAVAWRRGGAA